MLEEGLDAGFGGKAICLAWAPIPGGGTLSFNRLSGIEGNIRAGKVSAVLPSKNPLGWWIGDALEPLRPIDYYQGDPSTLNEQRHGKLAILPGDEASQC